VLIIGTKDWFIFFMRGESSEHLSVGKKGHRLLLPFACTAAAAATSPQGYTFAIFQPQLTSDKRESHAIYIPQQVCNSFTHNHKLQRHVVNQRRRSCAPLRNLQKRTWRLLAGVNAGVHAAQSSPSHAPRLSSTRTCTLLQSRCVRF
jgi:hypothetical protein